eukprot:10361252-Heterocapsa_arctica.AAC.1
MQLSIIYSFVITSSFVVPRQHWLKNTELGALSHRTSPKPASRPAPARAIRLTNRQCNYQRAPDFVDRFQTT